MKKNSPRLLISLLSAAFCTILVTCLKEYSYEGGPLYKSAAYTFAGAGGACTSPVLMGNYYIGTPLVDTNAVQLQVHVTTVGAYNIATNTTNGMYFALSGSFTDTGIQTITLKGRGTPSSAGSFSFSAAKDAGCSFSVAVQKKPVTMAGYSMAGSPNACLNLLVNGNYIYGDSLTLLNSLGIQVNVTSPGYYSISTDTLDGISFSASGTFSGTGIKQVTLNGHGTPGTPKNLAFTVSGSTSHCSFTVSITNPQPLATYVLQSGFGNPSPCIYTVAGNYHTDSALTTANTVSLQAYVTVPGNFTITTDDVNGMVFSYTGTFASTGNQTVMLAGIGIPVASGTFLLTPQIIGPHPLGGEVCAINIMVH